MSFYRRSGVVDEYYERKKELYGWKLQDYPVVEQCVCGGIDYCVCDYELEDEW